MINAHPTLSGVFTRESNLHEDSRGSFHEWFWEDSFDTVFHVSQGNISKSTKGTLRGIHTSLNPSGQAKWVTCIQGAILDLVVDLRFSSPTFGDWDLIEITGDSPKSIFIPSGMGHGFLALQEQSIVSYLTSSPYNPAFEVAINPFDQELKISWPKMNYLLSDKDEKAMSLKAFREKIQGE